ncbi:hypothetical protein J116_000170 [Streptomyces thermolilacinus SPC6]|uniref:Uncharacterized protein n=1 Tax=Streptomyces thermolilacinus SPC6 TaxID=1306406 RepID=A0A1D3DLD5_9ACTN|nr:hypothetical protein J116_000170 [Streptomyces thermolilacinus SPC6]
MRTRETQVFTVSWLMTGSVGDLGVRQALADEEDLVLTGVRTLRCSRSGEAGAGTGATEGRTRSAKRPIRVRVTAGARRDSPRATKRTALISSGGGGVLRSSPAGS